MKRRFLSMLMALTVSIGAMAEEVDGVTVKYVDTGTADYVQAISAIGRIEFKEGNATLVFKDAEAGTYALGAISEINRISFGKVDEADITVDTPTAVGDVERKVSVTAYPNPVADHVKVSGVAEGEILRLFSADGKLVYVGTDTDINLGGVNSGVYFLQVGVEVVKIIKK